MNEERNDEGGTSRSWLERLAQVFGGEPKDRAALLEILRDAEQRGLIDMDALSMIEGILQVSEMQVRDIMIPRPQMVVIERTARLEEILPVVIESGHSRFPVIGEDRDEVVGILLAKDLLRYRCREERAFDMRDVMRPPVFIPESKRLNVLLKDFRAGRNHLAIVVDEFGGVAGMVTIEDVLEQIVGEIADEHDIDEELGIRRRPDGHFVVKALTPVEEFNAYFHARLQREGVDTIGGIVAQEFGHVPQRGETIRIDGFLFRVLRADNRRIHLLEVMRMDAPPGREAQAGPDGGTGP
ncbi:MAG: CBS domain-containing protein [Gammaproteobacteria bacterium]|nr:MAG: CBS domain-containing protein [Gammaproteobacteria bacterium]